MQERNFFKTGIMVQCKDNENIETLVAKDAVYLVDEVSHRGALIQVQGVSMMLASSRFVPVVPASLLPMEVSHEGV